MTGGKKWSFLYERMREIIAVKMVLVGPSSGDEKSVNSVSTAATWLLSSATARSYPVTRPGRYGRYGYPV